MTAERSHFVDRPYRVTRRGDWAGPPLTPHQLRVLTSVVTLSPTLGGDLNARTVAEDTGIRLGSVVVILQSLAKRRLVIRLPGGAQSEPDAWRPTLTGYARVRHFRGGVSKGQPASTNDAGLARERGAAAAGERAPDEPPRTEDR